MLRRSIYVLGVLAGCKDEPSKVAPKPPEPIVVTDAAGKTVAELRPGHPCRATIGPIELIVGGPPVIATVGSTTWKGSTEAESTIFTRDNERIARAYPIGQPGGEAIFDMDGVAQIRVTVAKGVATVEDRQTIPVRHFRSADNAIVNEDKTLNISGTSDLVTAALLSAPEVLPEVRMLAACERELMKGSK